MSKTDTIIMDTRTGPEPPKPDQLSELDRWRSKLGSSFKQASALISHIAKPVPHGTGDGSDLDPKERNALIRKLEGDIADLSNLDITDIKGLIEVQKAKMTGEMTDDKTYLMENIIRVILAIVFISLYEL